MMNIKDLRREYLHDGLEKSGLEKNPLEQFKQWLDQAIKADLLDPTAMSIATVDVNGQPSQRIVLLKHADEEGLIFYTNFDSKKGQDIRQNTKVSLLFSWLPLERQVKIQGTALRLTDAESLAYFHSRPRASQIAAWCSNQSHVVDSRQALEDDFSAMQNKFKNGAIPLPAFWGGYRIKVSNYEFWQGRANRLHDSFVYGRDIDEAWKLERLAP